MSRDGEFVREAQSSLQELTNGLVELERDGGGREQVDELFRTAHTLKGNCSMAGLDSAARLAHAIEDFLSELRDGTVTVNPDLTDAALAAVDDIGALVREWQTHGTVETDPAATVATLRERTHEYRDESAAGSTMSSGVDTGELSSGDTDDTEGFDPSVVEALGSASEFDDLEKLLAEMDDPEEEDAEEMAPWGTFESTADEELGDDQPAEAAEDTDVSSEDEGAESMDEFASIKQNVEAGDISDLDRELVDVEFGEFDEDDNLSIQDLLDSDLTDDDPLDSGIDAEADHDGESVADTAVDVDSPAKNDVIRLEDFETGPTGHEAPAESPKETTVDDVTAAEAQNTNPFEAADVVDPTETTASNPFEPVEEPVSSQTADTAESAETPAEFPAVDFPDDEEFDLSGDEGPVTVDDDVPDLSEDEAFGLTDDEEPVTDDNGAFDLSDNGEVDFSEDDVPDLPDYEAFDLSDDGAFDLSDDGEDDRSDDDEPLLSDEERALLDDGEFGDPRAEADAEPSEEAPSLSPGDADDVDFPDIDLPDVDGFDGSAFADTAAEAHASAFDVSFDRDEHTVAFESRFAERFGGGADGDETASLVQSAVTTIEDSSLDAARFQSSGPTEYTFDIDTTHQADRIQSITVDVQNADTLLNLVEELSLAQLRLKQAASDDLDDHLLALDSVTSDLRRTVMDLRLMPLSTVVDGLPRVVRDVARQQDKQVAFEVSDEGVHLDRSIVEKLGDPLIHLIRNAVDHGIEAPAERERKDKPPEGTVELRAWRERERVIIELSDDGQGISAERVRQQAIENDIVSRDKAERMPLDEVYDLVFEPGFSTADEVTDVSGRGVGMDAVRRTINSLDGTVSVRSEPDSGTTVQIRLPVSVAVSKMLFITVGSEEYAIPTSAVDSVETLDEDAVTDDGQVLVEREDDDADEPERVSLLRLHEVFDVDADADADHPQTATAANHRGGGHTLVRLDTDVRRLALVCDDVDDAREVVVKPYEKLLGDVPGISGATMGGDGTLVNIIDVATL